MGIQQALFAVTSGEIIIVPNFDAVSIVSQPPAEAIYELDHRGASSITSVDPSPDWVIPAPPDDSSIYEVRATVQSGTNPTGDNLGVWLSLQSTRKWILEQNQQGTTTANVFIEIRATGGSVLDSAYVNITATLTA